MKKLAIYSLVILTTLMSCSDRYQSKTEITDFISSKNKTTIVINNIDDFKSLTKNNAIFKAIEATGLLNKFSFLNNTHPIYLSKSDSSVYIMTKYHKNLLPTDTTKTSNLKEVTKHITKQDTTYYKIIDSIYIGALSKKHLTNITKQKNNTLNKLLGTRDKNSIASIITKTNFNSLVLQNEASKNSNIILDLNAEGNSTNLNGILTVKDSLNRFNAFNNTKPQVFNLSKTIPLDSEQFIRVGYDDFDTFYKNNSKSAASINVNTSLLKLTNEVTYFTYNKEEAIAIHALDAELLKETIESQSEDETFKNITIFNFDQTEIFNTVYKPFFSLSNVNKGFIYEDFVVFAKDSNTLKSIISEILNKNTLFNSDKFKSINLQLADDSSLLIYKNETGLKDFLKAPTNGYNANIIQYVNANDFLHVHGVFSKYKKRKKANTISDNFSVQLPSEILSKPQIIKTRNKTHNIIVQDVNNILYQISDTGKILWKRQLNGAILGKINQIDMFKNGRLQIAFATQDRIYIIDKNGKDAGAFPLKFKNKITQPLSVFDYENQRNYRLLVTQDKSLLMYNTKAKRLKGFNYKKAKHSISKQPKHIRIGRKDYIVFSQKNKLEIIDRQGKERIRVKKSIPFSKNEIYNYKNKFATISNKGELIYTDTKGNVSVINNGYSENTTSFATTKTLATLTENKLKIKSNSIDLDFGDYTAPEIFYLKDKIYVTTTDLQAKKVYVFDSNAKLLPNFPIFGTAAAKITDLDNANNLELVTQSNDKTIISYKLN